MTDKNIYFEEAFKALSDVSDDIISVDEDTIKVKDGKWTNKGKEGTHGFFKTKKEADAQRKAMFVNESKEDKQAFIDKFGQEDYDKFLKMKDRLKNNKVSVDIVYHTAHTSREDMDKLLSDTENKVVKDNATGDKKMNVVKAYEDDKWIIYDVKDWETALNLGDGTGWCITGRYKTKGEVKPSQAEHYFNEYLAGYYTMYLFVMDKSTGKAEYCICPRQDSPSDYMDVWNKEDRNIGYTDKIPEFEYNGFKYFNKNELRVVDDKLVGKATEDLESYEIPEGVKKIPSGVFSYCKNLKSIKIPDSVTSIDFEAFRGCEKLDNVTLPRNLTFLGYASFRDCKSLKKIVLPNGLEEVGINVFSKCKSLKEVTFSNSINSLSYNSFEKCLSLNEIVLPDSLKQLDSFCFRGCINLKKVFIPKGVSNVNFLAFNGCKNLTIYCEAESQPSEWDRDWNSGNRPVVWGCTKEKYLTEDFKYSVNDTQQMKDAKEEIENKKNPDEDIEQVVDLNADDESQLKDSYVGDIVLRCTTCHTLVYKKPEEIVKDEDDELVNKEDECPNCNATTGYEVIGKVVPLKDDDEKEEDNTSSEDTTQEEEKPEEENVESDNKEETTEEHEEEHKEEEKEDSHDEEPKEEREVSDDFIDEIDNESFNHAINSYLCETYDNVKSYEMTDGTIDENGVMLIEGTITFKSGKTLNTSFKLMNDGETTKGLTKYKGMNESLAKDENSFKLVCTKDKTKLVTESLVYNYLADDNKTRVYGKTTRK